MRSILAGFMPPRALHSYQVRAVRSAAEWAEYFNAAPHPHLMQAYSYGEAKQAAAPWHAERVVFEQGKTPVAICQALQFRIAGLPLATRINRGPIFLDAAPSVSVREEVMGLVRRRWRTGRGGPLLIAPALEASEETSALMTGAGFRPVEKRTGWRSALMDLSLPEDEIRQRVASVWRNRLKAALNSGLEARISNDERTLEWMLDRHAENQREKGFVGPSRKLLCALYQANPDDFQIVQAVHAGQVVGGMALVKFGSVMEYYVGWFGEAGRKHNVGNFLYWHSMRAARNAGARWFDLGGFPTDEKFGQFKKNMRGTEYRLTHEWLAI